MKQVDKKTKSKKIIGFNLVEVVVIVIITAILSSLGVGFVLYKHYEESTIATYDKLKNNENVNEFLKVYSSIIDEYYQNVNEKELVDSAINAMFTYLGDTYSEHLTKDETSSLLEKLAGKYNGIGVEIYKERTIYNVFDDSPAKKVGLKPNDVIISINGTDVTSKSNAEVANMIKEANGEITIGVKRDNETLEFKVTKDNLYIPSVYSEIFEENNKKYGYIQITTFSTTTSTQFSKILKRVEGEGIDGLIIDVRSNSGGYLISAKEIASMFIQKGKVIYSLEEKNRTKKYRDTTSEKRGYKVVVLTNEYSASASEVLTAALKDSYGATIVGKKTYGKGKIQQTLDLDDGSLAKYTTAKWLTPKGKCIDEVGIKPDYEVDLQIDEEQGIIVDDQLTKAKEVIAK